VSHALDLQICANSDSQEDIESRNMCSPCGSLNAAMPPPCVRHGSYLSPCRRCRPVKQIVRVMLNAGMVQMWVQITQRFILENNVRLKYEPATCFFILNERS
jgi:hypothetical protein